LAWINIRFSNRWLYRMFTPACAADRPDVAVGNDFGTVLPGDRFVALLRERPDWDWRREPRRSPRPERPGS
jgi:hypothetical protein